MFCPAQIRLLSQKPIRSQWGFCLQEMRVMNAAKVKVRFLIMISSLMLGGLSTLLKALQTSEYEMHPRTLIDIMFNQTPDS